MEDAYDLLVSHKNKDESFSQEIRRILGEKKRTHKLIEIFGILSKEEGEGMRRDLEKMKKFNVTALRERLDHEGF